MTYARVSEDFRVTIPEEIRRVIPLTPGQNLMVAVRNGVITLVPDRSTTPTLDDLAAAQGVEPADSFESLCGGWPEEELEDGFEDAIRHWRDAELRHRG